MTVFTSLVVGFIFVLFKNVHESDCDARLKNPTIKEIFDLLKNICKADIDQCRGHGDNMI